MERKKQSLAINTRGAFSKGEEQILEKIYNVVDKILFAKCYKCVVEDNSKYREIVSKD
jgi:hypothetical protein